MKPKFSLFTLAALSACMVFDALADQTPQQNQTTPPIILKKDIRTTPIKRPKAPDRQIVTCAYDGEELHLTFVVPEGTASLSVTDETLLTATYQFDTTPLEVSIPVGQLWGNVSIELTTELDNTYTGSM